MVNRKKHRRTKKRNNRKKHRRTKKRNNRRKIKGGANIDKINVDDMITIKRKESSMFIKPLIEIQDSSVLTEDEFIKIPDDDKFKVITKNNLDTIKGGYLLTLQYCREVCTEVCTEVCSAVLFKYTPNIDELVEKQKGGRTRRHRR